MAATKTTKAKPSPDPNVINVKVRGIAISINPTVMADYELLENMTKADKNLALLPSVMEKLLGTVQHELMKNKLRDKNGIVNLETVGEFAAEMFAEIEKQAPNL